MGDLKKRTLGKSGIEVTEIGLGLWAAGGDEWGATDDQKILDTIDWSLDHGINFYDTSDVYGMGHSEELLGQAMQGRRDQFIVATKIGWVDFDEDTQTSAYDTVEKLIAGVEKNLKRLQTDYVDILQNHINIMEPNTDIFLEAFERLQKDGKVRGWGASSSHFDFIQYFNQTGGCATLQIDYSILNRMAEKEIFPYCQQENIGVIVRGGLAMGILTGKFTKDIHFEEGDFRRSWHENEEEYRTFLNDLEIVEGLKPLVKENRSLAQVALLFTLAHPAVTTVIPGAKNIRQMEDNLAAGLMEPLTEDELVLIESLVPVGGGRRIWPA